MKSLHPPFAFALLALATIAPCLACSVHPVAAEREPPPRPSAVPHAAVWAGGVDGGAFILLESTALPARYAGTIYDDVRGEVIYRGALWMKGPRGARIDVADPKAFSAWDGETLYLRDGRTLDGFE